MKSRVPLSAPPTSPAAVPLHGRFETAFHAKVSVAAPCAVEIIVEFTSPAGMRQRVRAFWWGSREWRVRFSPTVAGKWSFRSRSKPRIPGLDAQRGTFACSPAFPHPVPPSLPASHFIRHGPLKLSRNRRHFAHADGTTFFWLGDTVWNGPTMARSGSDWERFLDLRVAQGFNVIQFVATQWRTAPTNPDGEVAYTGRAPIWINPHWFERLDQRMDAIAARGLLAAPVLVWTLGRDEVNPSTLPESEIIRLARYMVARYGAHPVVWILNGDGRYYGPAAEKWRRIGRAVFDFPGHAPVAQHPGGMQWPHDAFEDEDWIDFLGYQSGHGDDAETLQWIHSGPPARKWREGRARPALNLEPPYEDHICYQSRKRHDAFTVRRAAWWSLLNAPPAGLTYGAHGVWGWEETVRPPADHPYTGVAQPWHVAMKLPGASHTAHLAALFRRLPWWQLQPAPDLVLSQPRAPRRPGRTHLIFTRNLDGESALWVNGRKRNAAWLGGDFSTWVADTRLALGNESTGDFGWRGTFHRVAFYDRALTPAEISASSRPSGRSAERPLAAWSFHSRRSPLRDTGGRLGLDLEILTPTKTAWRRDGLFVDRDAEIKSTGSAAPLVAALQTTNALSIELVLTPGDWNHRACGRILSLQVDRWNRNLALTQVATEFTAHLRTSSTSGNAEPALPTAVAQSAFEFVSAAAAPDGGTALAYLPVGGSVRLARSRLARRLKSEWFDPRTGKCQPAPHVRGRFTAPDQRDWVLCLTRS